MKNTSVRITTIIAVLLSFLWIFGFAWTIQDFTFGQAEGLKKNQIPSKAEQTKTTGLTVLALGDSLTRGTGDEQGKGYVGLVTEELKKQLRPKEILVYNLGINGQTSSELLKQLNQRNISRQMKEADIILMTIGGNDLFQQGKTLYQLSLETVRQLQKAYLFNLDKIFSTIHRDNPNATVFILGLYNPFIDLDNSKITNTVIREWNYATESTTDKYENIVFVPTFDLFQLSVNDYLYSDHFHPNKAGYQLISDRLAPLIHWEKEAEENE